MKRTLTVSEARKQLPRLLQEIARGGGPFYVGARGVATAVLASVAEHEGRASARRGGAGSVSEGLGPWEAIRLEVVGDPGTIQADIRKLREEAVESSLASWDRMTAGAKAPPKRRRARR